jgi:hypothetical protein
LILVAGGAGTGLKGGRHIRYEKGTPLANLHLTLLDRVGVHLIRSWTAPGKSKIYSIYRRLHALQKDNCSTLQGLTVAVPAIAALQRRSPMPRTTRSGQRPRASAPTSVDVNAAQVDGTTALHWAAYNDDAETVALLLRAKANVNVVNRYAVPPLALACTNGNAATAKLLLEAGANANATMKGGETVLMLASRSGNAEVVKALLARGAKHDTRERHGQTALMWAASEGNTAVVRTDRGRSRHQKRH